MGEGGKHLLAQSRIVGGLYSVGVAKSEMFVEAVWTVFDLSGNICLI